MAIAQSVDALAIPVRKNGAEAAPIADQNGGKKAAVPEKSATDERAAARRLTSKLRADEGSDSKKTENSKSANSAQTRTEKSAPQRESSSPVINARQASLYTLGEVELPTGLLRKRTSGAVPAPPSRANEEQQESGSRRTATYTSSDQNRNNQGRNSDSDESRVKASRDSDKTESAQPESGRRVARSDRSSEGPSEESSTESRKAAAEAYENSESIEVRQEANMAALDNLRPATRPAESGLLLNAPGAPQQLGAMQQDDAASASAPAAGFGRQTLASNQPPSQAPPPPAPSNAGTETAAAAPLTPNLYLPQATPAPRRGSIWSRLFGRHNRQASATVQPAVIDFNSDYATRDGTDVCPVVLPGYGINGRDIPYGQEDMYRLTSSLPDHFRPTDLVRIPTQYCHYGNALYLRREAAASLCRMISDAAQQGLTIRVVSAFRDYDHQMRLYTQAVAREGEDQKSVARPGRSEHYLGTTVDLTNDEEHALDRSFGDTAEGRWLAANAGNYGFKLTVMSRNARRSHNDEPWHLRYLGSALNNPPSAISPIAQQHSQPQHRDVFGAIGRFLGLRR